MFTAHYQSLLGEILLAADEVGLTGLWFDRAKYYAAGLAPQSTERETPPLTEAKRWLDVYFSGKMPDFMPPLHPIGSDFRQEVWALLLQIPYGQTTTYGALAARLAAKHGMARLSAQAAARIWWRTLPTVLLRKRWCLPVWSQWDSCCFCICRAVSSASRIL